jgi:hypothetical protein
VLDRAGGVARDVGQEGFDAVCALQQLLQLHGEL